MRAREIVSAPRKLGTYPELRICGGVHETPQQIPSASAAASKFELQVRAKAEQ